MKHLREEELWELAAGEMPAGDPRATHVESCTTCHRSLVEKRQVRRFAVHARPAESSPASRVMALDRLEQALAVENQQTRRWLDRRPFLLPAFGLSAVAGALLVVMLDSSRIEPQVAWEPPPEAAPAMAAVPAPAPAVPVVADAEIEAALPSDGDVEEPPRVPPRRATTPRKTMVAMAPIPPPAPSTVVEVEALVRFPLLAQAREKLGAGQPAAALDVAIDRMASETPGEHDDALAVVREVALQNPTEEVVQRVEGVTERFSEDREALEYLACEASVLGRHHADSVRRCRTFVSHFPSSQRARDASYVAGTLAREHLGDCEGAVKDYTNAMVFAGALGSLNDDALFWRAYCHVELGRKDEGRQDLSQFLARYPSRRVDPKVRSLQQKMAGN